MSNNNNRANPKNTNNQRTVSNTGNSGTNAQTKQSSHVWVVRPSFTIGVCRVYSTKADALKDFGRDESLWVEQNDYNIDHNLDGERLIIDKSPVWDSDYDVQWEMEKLEVRPRTIPAVTQPKVPEVKIPEKVDPVVDQKPEETPAVNP